MAQTGPAVRPAVVGRRPSKRFIAGKAVREFFADECWDRAASMTFFGVLSIPPLAVALTSVLALVGQGETSTQAVLDVLAILAPDDEALETVSAPVMAVLRHPAAGLSFTLGLATALWISAGYVGAFGRAMNQIYGVHEGRPLWRLTAWHLLTTVVLVAFGTLVVLLLVVSGPVARAVGTVLGLGDTAVQVWEVARTPVLLLTGVLMVDLLYYATPNVRHPRFRLLSPGSVAALALVALVSLALRLYIQTFDRFDITYGAALAGVVVFCVWLWIINMALLLGAELDTEVARARQLVAGIRADVAIQLPVRDSRATERAARRRAADQARAKSLRESHGWFDDDRPDGEHDTGTGARGEDRSEDVRG